MRILDIISFNNSCSMNFRTRNYFEPGLPIFEKGIKIGYVLSCIEAFDDLEPDYEMKIVLNNQFNYIDFRLEYSGNKTHLLLIRE